MALVAAKCTNCGANIEVDNTKELGVCEFCETTFYVEKVINNYNTNNYITNYQTITRNVYHEELDVEDMIKNAETFIILEEYKKAENIYKELIDIAPYNYKVWSGMARAITSNFTDLDAPLIYFEYYEKAIKLARDPERELLIKEHETYLMKKDENEDIYNAFHNFFEDYNQNFKKMKLKTKFYLFLFLLLIFTIILIFIITLNS
jgi:tetratricopeptide (TPR) repeat protein